MDRHVGKVTELFYCNTWKWECNCGSSSSGRTYKTKQAAQERLDAHIERMK